MEAPRYVGAAGPDPMTNQGFIVLCEELVLWCGVRGIGG